MLENNSELFQGDNLQELSWIWGSDAIKKGELISVDINQIKEALSI